MASPWRYALEYRAVAAVAAAVRALPQWASLAIGAAIGWLFYIVDAPHRRLTVANLAAAFPHKRPAEIRAIARGVFVHFGSLLTELLRFSGLPPAKMLASVEFEGGAAAGREMQLAGAAVLRIGDLLDQALALDRAQVPGQGGRVHDHLLGQRADGDTILPLQLG